VFNHPGRILSLDMGNHSYKYIEAQLSNKLQILRYGLCQEAELFNSDFPAKMWKKIGCRSRDVVLSFHHKSLITRELKLQADNELQLQHIIQDEFQKYQTDLKEEYDFDYSVQSHDSESGIYFTKTAGISKRINRGYIEKAISLGLKPRAVDIQLNAFIRVIRKILLRCKELSEELPYLVLDLGYENTTAALINIDEIIALKGIPIGCRIIEESPANSNEYLQEIIILCWQMIDHYIHSSHKEELQQGILYGGGAFAASVLSHLKDQIPLRWNQLNHFRLYLSEIPTNMDLNLYANCLGSLYWEGDKLNTERKIRNDRF
jgi:Tfp pilus assembly PilM family ATPase